ncbi:interleukin-18-binding protein isoform X2 [Pogoniulus pusillus]|uniref:interleukin-18-binding protein isoform X2 n=1 Tax=Pogoniulus pusillus TaxID=488313 RepID=UPI0030B93784
MAATGTGSAAGGAVGLQPPSITSLRTPAQRPHLGAKVRVSCHARSSLPQLSLLYWLGNGSFVESLRPEGTLREGTTLEVPCGPGLVALRRDLLFSSFSSWHLHTNFTCVLLSPMGAHSRELSWPPAAQPQPGSSPTGPSCSSSAAPAAP